MVNELSGREPKEKIEVIANKIKSLEDSIKSIKKANSFMISLIIFGLLFILYDSWGLKNDLSQERYQLLKEQINSKCI